MYEKKHIEHSDIIEDVIKSKNGDSNSLEKILDVTEHIIQYTIKNDYKRISLNNLEIDDVWQEMRISTINAVNKFNDKKHNNFIGYLFAYLKNDLFTYIMNNVNYINKSDISQGIHSPISLYTQSNDDELNPSYLMDMMVDEKTLIIYDEIDDRLNNSANNIRNILEKFVSCKDVDFLFDFYNISNRNSIKDMSIIYNKPINEIIAYERLIILSLKTNSKIYNYYEDLISNVSINYSYSFNKFKNTFTSSTKYSAISDTYLSDKFNKMLKDTTLKTIHRNILKENSDFEYYRFDFIK